jgi:ABC-type uncharacterized transport system substrate-binding protein
MLKFLKRAPASTGALVIAALLAGGCATEPERLEPVEESRIVVVPPVEPLPELELPPARQASRLMLPQRVAETPIAIVVSGRQAAYVEVAESLAAVYTDAAVYEIGGDQSRADSVMRNINDAGSRAVVAIGLVAAQSAIARAESPVVYAQVFNHSELDSRREDVHGVAAYSPLAEQLEAWKNLATGLDRVGIILGPGHEDLVEEARAAAQRHDVELTVRITSSDQETLYAFRRMSRDIDGFWLFPDNRVLSSRALREMAAIGRRNRVRFAVPNEGMLSLGAAVALTTVAEDIAAVIAVVLDRVHRGETADLPSLSALREVDVVTGRAMADAR